jgi:hypothetical protein
MAFSILKQRYQGLRGNILAFPTKDTMQPQLALDDTQGALVLSSPSFHRKV